MKNNHKYSNIIILHGCPPSEDLVTPPNNRWMNWTRDKLLEIGYEAFAPNLPSPWAPSYAKWKKEIERYPITNKSLLVGHSCGGAFLVRYLNDKNLTVAKLILVAPAKIPETPDDKRGALYQFNLESISANIAKEIVIFTSNDFPHHLHSLALYQSTFPNSKIISLPNKGHFLYYQMKTNEFPELLKEILS